MAESDNAPKVIRRKEAKQLGLKHYFTGKKCKHGHIAERTISSGECRICGDLRVRHWRKANPEKAKHILRASYAKHRLKRLAENKEWCRKNGERRRAARRKNYAINRVAIGHTNKLWRLRNPERHKIVRQGIYQRNKQKINETTRRYQQRFPEVRREIRRRWKKKNPDKVLAEVHKRRARKLGNGGSHTPEDIADICKLQKHKCAYCRIRLTRKSRRIDHIVPISKGGSNDRRNLQILCDPCNSRKWAFDQIDVMRAMGKLL